MYVAFIIGSLEPCLCLRRHDTERLLDLLFAARFRQSF